MNKAISVVIIDNDMVKINYIKESIRDYDERIHLVAIAENAAMGLKMIRKHNPKIVFIDINMTDYDGVTLLERLKKWDFELIILENSEFYRLLAGEKQKAGFILKKIDISQLTA